MTMATFKRILLTGGAGLIGSHIADALVEGQHAGRYGKIVILDNLVRGRPDNLAAARAR
jgi:UDP-glucose 4-epimerase